MDQASPSRELLLDRHRVDRGRSRQPTHTLNIRPYLLNVLGNILRSSSSIVAILMFVIRMLHHTAISPS